LPQIEDAPGEVSFLNEDTRPDRCQQIIFFNYASGALHQDDKHLNVFGRQRYGLSLAP
jgi:hypothetical protein